MSAVDPIAELLTSALRKAIADGLLPPAAAEKTPRVVVPKTPEQGHFSSPVALSTAKLTDSHSPQQLAQALIERLPPAAWLERAEVAGAGYINFFLSEAAAGDALLQVLDKGADYGKVPPTGERVLVEFVSSNPTGPLHIGHGRGGAVGDSLAAVLEAAGAEVEREYYVNDRGRQSLVLALSACLRHFNLPLPKRAYQGDYVGDILPRDNEFLRQNEALAQQLQQILAAHSSQADEDAEEALLDQLIAAITGALGEKALAQLCRQLHRNVLAGIAGDLQRLNVRFDRWFSEDSLFSAPAEKQPVAALTQRMLADGHAEKRADGAVWFLSSRYGDDKDRVLIRRGGEPTYFAADVAYHMDKFARGYDRIINVWGADHHGYEPRIRGALRALGAPEERLTVIYVQFVSLLRDGERIGMSTRGASFVSLAELLDNNIPAASVRLTYLSCSSAQHLDFDLDAAVARDRNNPAYYIQYAHARICSLEAKAKEGKLMPKAPADAAQMALLKGDREMQLQKMIGRYPELVVSAATHCEPHRIAVYLRELAALFHSWYNAERVLTEETELRAARLAMCAAAKQVFANGLKLLGVEAPQSM